MLANTQKLATFSIASARSIVRRRTSHRLGLTFSSSSLEHQVEGRYTKINYRKASCMAFSPDSSLFAAGYPDEFVIWETDSGIPKPAGINSCRIVCVLRETIFFSYIDFYG